MGWLRLQVTSPQLSLLEATLASMDRVDAFIMMRQQRAPGNVFAEANRWGPFGDRVGGEGTGRDGTK